MGYYLVSRRLWLILDEYSGRKAAFTINPYSKQDQPSAQCSVTQLETPADGAMYDWFGYSVSVSGDILVVGAHQATVSGNWKQGAAYVFTRNQGGADAWGQVARLTAADGAADDWFGTSVLVSGDTLVVGAHGAAVGGLGRPGRSLRLCA